LIGTGSLSFAALKRRLLYSAALHGDSRKRALSGVGPDIEIKPPAENPL
jgi:hypothetical protein